MNVALFTVDTVFICKHCLFTLIVMHFLPCVSPS